MDCKELKSIDELELETQEYSVYITDDKQTSNGSGILFYPGEGDSFYVFTCAHVVDSLIDPIHIYLLCPIDRNKEEYQICKVSTTHEKITYSPLDEITEEMGAHIHSVDIAIISLTKDKDLILQETKYFFAEVVKGNNVLAQGYPGKIGNPIQDLLENLDTIIGKVRHNNPRKNSFTFRTEDSFLDPANRVYELQGFSGSPLWLRDNVIEDVPEIAGLVISGMGQTVYRGNLNAVNIEAVKSIMKNHFHILIPSRIEGIPEEDIALGRNFFSCNKIQDSQEKQELYDQWILRETEKVRAYIDDIKFQKAIDIAKNAIKDSRFEFCSTEKRKEHMSYLLYCYEVCGLDEEFNNLEIEMNAQSVLRGHDPLRWMTLNFNKRNFKEVINYADKIINEKENPQIVILAEILKTMSRAYEENLPVEETVRIFLDEKEYLTIEGVDLDEERFIYQILGYVYGECYKDYIRAIRCLNRAYCLGYDNAVRESLGCAYYFMGIQKAMHEDDTVDVEKVDRASLYKARKCFLIILEKADELYIKSMMKRVGIVIYNTFFFLRDNYRVLTIYPLLKNNLPQIEEKILRDIEMKYARLICAQGSVDLQQFTHLTRTDRKLLWILGKIGEMLRCLDGPDYKVLQNDFQTEKELCQTISIIEKNKNDIEERERIPVIAGLINLYGWGRRIWNWDVATEIEDCVSLIRCTGNTKMIMAFEDFLYENTHILQMAEQKYLQTWKQYPSFISWQEVLQFYKRNGILEKADAWFEDLFANHAEYIKQEPEYAYRAYIEYIVDYRRDLQKALKFYIQYKDEMLDECIKKFWKQELMVYTNSFNNPESFERERSLLVSEGFIPENEFHRIVLIAYMCNLNSTKAWEHFSRDNPYFGICNFPGNSSLLTREGAQFLVWQRKISPHKEPDWDGMFFTKVDKINEQLLKEAWHVPVEVIISDMQVAVQRKISVDSWALYLLAVSEQLYLLEEFDVVYVTHCSIARMLDEMCHYENVYLHSVIAYLEILENVKIQSPEFEAQIIIRDKTEYCEAGSAIAMAIEEKIPVIIGEPSLRMNLIDSFKDYIIRPYEIEKVVEQIKGTI